MQQTANIWNTELYNQKHSFVYDYGTSLIELLNPTSTERILDLGCGSGELTFKIDEMALEVLGVDKSPEMIKRAKSQFPVGDFLVGDASTYESDKPFDAIFSNAALHWVLDYKKAISCIYRNLKEGGRIVIEFGGKGNVAAIVEQLRASLSERGYSEQAQLKLWFFPSISEYTTALEAEGFKVSYAELYDRSTELADADTGIIDWLMMFGQPFFKGVTDNDRESILKEIENRLYHHLFKDGKWYADYKRIRVVAHR